MQDLQNIPNPDVDSVEIDDRSGFGSHSDISPGIENNRNSQDSDIESPREDIPLPPDSQTTVPVEEPPEINEQPGIGEDNTEPQRLV
jgi:hypothetical protein